MARNKYPEETVEKILSASMRLFVEKGYEHTSIQDIIDQLGGLTKGAIYHHFKSKEDILLALANQMGDKTEAVMGAIRDDPALTGLEKLRAMFHASIGDHRQHEIFSAAPKLLDNPQFLSILLQNLVRDVAPHYIRPVVEQGVADGSIHTDHPAQLAEMLILLSDFWLNPLVWPTDPEGLAARLELYHRVLLGFGVDVMDDTLREALMGYLTLASGKS